MNNRLLALLGPLVGLCLVSLAVWVLHHELRSYHLTDIAAHLREIPTGSLLASAGLTLLGYLALTGYDALAFRFVGTALSYPRIALASFLGFVFSHNIGVSFLGGGAVRLRELDAERPNPEVLEWKATTHFASCTGSRQQSPAQPTRSRPARRRPTVQPPLWGQR